MAMGQKCPVFSDRDLLLPVCLGEEVIISAHHADHAVIIIYPFLKICLAALGIAQVDQHIERGLFLNNFPEISISSVGIAHDQNFHTLFSDLFCKTFLHRPKRFSAVTDGILLIHGDLRRCLSVLPAPRSTHRSQDRSHLPERSRLSSPTRLLP